MAVDLDVNDNWEQEVQQSATKKWEEQRKKHLDATKQQHEQFIDEIHQMFCKNIPKDQEKISDYFKFFYNPSSKSKICPIDYKPIRNCSEDKNLFPLDQTEYRGWAYNQRNGTLVKWFKLPAPERINGGTVWVGFKMGNELRWEKKAAVVANRFLYKNPGDVVKFKDGDSTNCRLQNLEWSQPWMTEGNSNNKVGIKGIQIINKVLAGDKTEIRYKVKLRTGSKTFKTLEEAKTCLMEENGVPASEEKEVIIEKLETEMSDGED